MKALAVCLYITMACQNAWAVTDIDRARAAVLEKLKDPESARFRNIRSVGPKDDLGEVICGEVNAKNEMGGYVGFQTFFFTPKDGGVLIPGQHRITTDPLDSIALTADRFCK